MSDPQTPTPKPVRRNADQDQEIANLIEEVAQYNAAVRGDPVIRLLMAERGYDDAKLAEGDTLQKAAQTTFTHRQTAMASQNHATAGLTGAGLTAYEMYVDFRQTVQVIATFTASDRIALKVNGPIPKDKQKMITVARTSYEAAQQAPYAATLATYGFPQATLANALAALDAYSTADTDQNNAIGDAVSSTLTRNAAIKNLKAYYRQIRGIAKVALRKRPDLLKKLNG